MYDLAIAGSTPAAYETNMMTKTKQNNVSKKFRLRGMKFFLTYPQLPERDDLQSSALAQFEVIFKMSSADFQYVMSVERHEDGHPHLHVYLEFSTSQGIYSAGKLDLVFDGVTYHGNYQVVKSEHATIRYILKSLSDSSEAFTNKDLPLHDGDYYSSLHEHLHEVLLSDGLYAAIQVLYNVYPKQAVKNGSTIVRNLQMMDDYYQVRKDINEAPKYTMNDFTNVPNEIKAWLDSKKPMTVVIWGPSGVGKTELAKAVLYAKGKRVLFVREIQALKDFEPGFHDAIIFDDLNVSETPREQLIHLVDVDNASDLRLLYRGKRLPARIDKVFTTNTISYFNSDAAVQRRVFIIHIPKSIILLSSTSSSAPDDITSPVADAARVGGIETIQGDNLLSDSFRSDLFLPPSASSDSKPKGMYVRNPDYVRSPHTEPSLFVPFKDTSFDPTSVSSIHSPSLSVSSQNQSDSSFVPAEIIPPVSISSSTTPAINTPTPSIDISTSVASVTDSVDQPLPKKRGRPKGSKNKKK